MPHCELYESMMSRLLRIGSMCTFVTCTLVTCTLVPWRSTRLPAKHGRGTGERPATTLNGDYRRIMVEVLANCWRTSGETPTRLWAMMQLLPPRRNFQVRRSRSRYSVYVRGA